MATQRRARNQKGVSLFVAALSLLFIIPMSGLMIDAAVLYVVKARLQAAVDGAALAAARALVLGQTTSAQASSAQQNAINWFYANFPPGDWGTSGTVMNTASVTVQDDPNVPQMRDVNITASTNAPTYFMKWFNYGFVNVVATGNASRRDVVVMLVLDRSGSMSNAHACGTMISAAKLFTGQFAEGRDRIGLVSFSDNVYLHSAPSTTFQTTLGYTNTSGSGSGALDNISCAGDTMSATGISVAYNELVKTGLPGALNIILLETDGLPNTLTLNFWDSANSLPGVTSSTCQDQSGRTVSSGGWGSSSAQRQWTNGYSVSGTTLPAGSTVALLTTDPGSSTGFFTPSDYQSGGTSDFATKYISGTSTPGCGFPSAGSTTPRLSSLSWFPATDVFGNALAPASNRFVNVTTDSKGHITNPSSGAWTNFHNAALNATDNAAYNARASTVLPPGILFYTIGLGGTSSNPPDYVLMQRMANDPNGDNFNTPALYSACAQEANCVTYPSQPQGMFIFSSDPSDLSAAFLRISSQILRLSK